ncbi:MAG: hypothetical protein JWO06_896 [Bacteroidota bacterium]|nr:hypothetical protein [Bacteroidota bacterium]
MKKLFFYYLLFVLLPGLKAQTNYRLVGYRKDNYNTSAQAWHLIDSIVFGYSGIRSGLDINNRAYDSAVYSGSGGNSSRVIQQFDNNNRVVDVVNQGWDSINWVNNSHITYTYNPAGKTTAIITQIWSNNSWHNNRKQEYTFSGNDSMAYIESITDSGQWFVDYRMTFERNAQHLITRNVEEEVGATHNLFDTVRDSYFAYDNFNNIVTYTVLQPYGGPTLDSSSRTDYTYYSNHLPKSNRRATGTGLGLALYDGYEYSYYGNNLIYSQIYGVADVNGVWQPYDEQRYTYNAALLLDTMALLYPTQGDTTWYVQQQQLYDYTAGGDKIQFIYQFDNGTDGMQTISQINYQYDNNHLLQYDITLSVNNDTATNSGQEFFWYQPYATTSNVVALNDESLSVYPNPAHNYFDVEVTAGNYHALTLSDINGQQILNEKVADTTSKISITSTGFAPGIYLLQLNGQNGSVSKKIILQ